MLPDFALGNRLLRDRGVDLGHQRYRLLQGDDHLLVVAALIIAQLAPLAVLEPLVEHLIAAHLEGPDRGIDAAEILFAIDVNAPFGQRLSRPRLRLAGRGVFWIAAGHFVAADLESAVQITPEELGAHIRLMAALKMFELGKLSSGKAAELADMTRAEFIEMCGRYRVSINNYPPEALEEELRSDIEAAQRASE